MTINNSTTTTTSTSTNSTLSITLILRYTTIIQHYYQQSQTDSTLSVAHLRYMPLATALATAGAKVAGAGLAWL